MCHDVLAYSYNGGDFTSYDDDRNTISIFLLNGKPRDFFLLREHFRCSFTRKHKVQGQKTLFFDFFDKLIRIHQNKKDKSILSYKLKSESIRNKF